MVVDILIGLITVTFINCSALCGAIILPFRKKPAFKWILSAFIGLGIRLNFILFRSLIIESICSGWNINRIRNLSFNTHGLCTSRINYLQLFFFDSRHLTFQIEIFIIIT